MSLRFDFLIVGSGIAGLTYAVKTAQQFPNKSIGIITKSDADETNTKYAQGGVAVVLNHQKDSFDKHISDTLDAGDGLCDETIVETVVKEGPLRINEIIEWGTAFDKGKNGNYLLGKEGGHTENRILHHKDITGKEIERSLLKKIESFKNIEIVSHHFVVELITQHHIGRQVSRATPNIKAYGVYVLNLITQKTEKILAKITVFATGGIGQVYKSTTNPTIATGDGIAMVYRAKGKIRNMEFVQFHPTALFDSHEGPSFLITEAVRGEGGILKTLDGKTFMEKYDPRKSLAPRDIVARAIDNEMKMRGDNHVFLDCRNINIQHFINHFPNIYEKCKSLNIDISKDMIPVVPSAHYSCGGIWVDDNGNTSIQNLFACGECASTGLHGANRLASNSLLEALVFAEKIFIASKQLIHHIEFEETTPDWNAEGTTEPKEMVLITQSRIELKEIMSNYVGIVRSDIRLKRALDRLHLLYQETEKLYENTILSPQLCELRNLITIGYLVTKSAAMRKESRGLHYTTDYLLKKENKDDTFL